jgi:FixJ family two-component response regulator
VRIITSDHGPAVGLVNTPLVSIVDPDASVREALESMVRSAEWRPLSFASAGEFLAVPRILAPGCLLLNASLPDLPGLELQKLLADRSEMPIIFMADYCDVATTVRAMKAGAFDFLMKPLRDDCALSVIDAAIERSRAGVRSEAVLQAHRERYASLSDRERQVMTLVLQGLVNKAVGAKLGISEITVKAHRGKMMRKMEATSLLELVAIAARLSATPAPKNEVGVNGRPPAGRDALSCQMLSHAQNAAVRVRTSSAAPVAVTHGSNLASVGSS